MRVAVAGMVFANAMLRSWNMRNSANQALALQRHNDLLAMQQLQLSVIQQDVSFGNALIVSQGTGLGAINPDIQSAQSSRQQPTRQRKHDLFRLRLPLPYWLSSRTWTLAASHSQGSWTMALRPVNRRPFASTTAFDCIRTGDLASLQQFLDTGELSMWDVTKVPSRNRELTLLGVCMGR